MNEVRELTLSEYLEQYPVTQGELAKKLGKSQGAISLMMRYERDIRVRVFGDGEIYVYEIKPVATA